jgi:hypothetical protein
MWRQASDVSDAMQAYYMAAPFAVERAPTAALCCPLKHRTVHVALLKDYPVRDSPQPFKLSGCSSSGSGMPVSSSACAVRWPDGSGLLGLMFVSDAQWCCSSEKGLLRTGVRAGI